MKESNSATDRCLFALVVMDEENILPFEFLRSGRKNAGLCTLEMAKQVLSPFQHHHDNGDERTCSGVRRNVLAKNLMAGLRYQGASRNREVLTGPGDVAYAVMPLGFNRR